MAEITPRTLSGFFTPVVRRGEATSVQNDSFPEITVNPLLELETTRRLTALLFYPNDCTVYNLARGQICHGRGARHRRQHIFFAHHHGGGVQRGKFKSMPMRNGVRRARFNAIAAEDAAVVIDVVDLGVAFCAGNPLLGCVLRRFNMDAVGRASRRA